MKRNMRSYSTTCWNRLVCSSLFVLMGMFFAACSGNQSGAAKKEAKDTKVQQPKAGDKQCYNYMEGGDTIVLTIKWMDSSRFTGSMVYSLREKDRNIGSLEGERKDSILMADYTFNAEGMTSKREVAFKKIADYIVEGFGDVTPDSSGFTFTHPDSLKFDLNRKYQQVNCL